MLQLYGQLSKTRVGTQELARPEAHEAQGATWAKAPGPHSRPPSTFTCPTRWWRTFPCHSDMTAESCTSKRCGLMY